MAGHRKMELRNSTVSDLAHLLFQARCVLRALSLFARQHAIKSKTRVKV